MHVPDDMLARYFERRKRDFNECLEHLDEGDFSFLEKIGHQLKGNGVTFGYPEISEIGKELESGARDEDLPSLSTTLARFSVWVNDHLN